MTKQLFEVYIETQLAPVLSKGQVVILDNLSSHKSEKAAQTLRDIGARTFDEVWKAVGDVCDMFSPQECRNYFKAAGYEFI